MTVNSGEGPIALAFRAARDGSRVALIPYVMAGYPDLASSEAVAIALAGAGADLLEIGIPFSDPLADGATIQAASHKSLEQGTCLADVLALANRIHKSTPVPLVLMGYFNPLLAFGLQQFCSAARAAGVSGLIVPDLPPEEADDFQRMLAEHSIELIFLVTPTSSEDRIRLVTAAASRTGNGFLYCVSLSGVTGARSDLPPSLAAFVARVRQHTQLPLAVGFGVSTAQHVAEIGTIADGAVVASALLDAVDRAPHDQQPDAAAAFLTALRPAIAAGDQSRVNTTAREESASA